MPLLSDFTSIRAGEAPLAAVHSPDGTRLWERPAPLPGQSFKKYATVASFDTSADGFTSANDGTATLTIGTYPGMTGAGALTISATRAATGATYGAAWLIQGSTAIRSYAFQTGAVLEYEVHVPVETPGQWRVRPSIANTSWSYQHGTYVDLTKGVVTKVRQQVPAGLEAAHNYVQLQFEVANNPGGTPSVIQIGDMSEGSWVDKLTWAPALLSSPQTISLDGTARATNLDLNTDYIIELPDTPITTMSGGLDINGGRNVTLIGGEINLGLQFDAGTAVSPTGFPSMTRGFTGATGGTFRVKASNAGAWSAPLSYTATAADVLAALEGLAGAGSVHSVTGSGTGGPWTITPALYDPRIGRIGLDLAGLTGTVTLTQTNANWNSQLGMLVRNWTGVMHLEGLYLRGLGLAEGINVATPHPDAVLQVQNCRIEPEFYRYHSDHHHPDAIQCFNGPASLRVDKSDLICRSEGQAVIGQPREQAWPGVLQALRDWRFRRTLFATYPDPYTGRSPSGLPLLREDDYPTNGQQQLGAWRWIMEDCYADAPSRVGHPDAAFGEFWYYDGSPPPPGLTTGALPLGGSFTTGAGAGIGYVSPGYADVAPPRGIDRLP